MDKIIQGDMEYIFVGGKCVDINIKPSATTAVFIESTASRYMNTYYILSDVKKSFPNIETLIINDGVGVIDISNFMFPNVKQVISKSCYFATGPYLCLISISDNGVRTNLKNAFCRQADEVIDLNGITEISDNAFAGCLSTTFINYDKVESWQSYSFKGSALELSDTEEHYCNGVYRLGNMIYKMDSDCDKIEIPKGIKCISPRLCSGLNTVIVSDLNTIVFFPVYAFQAKTLILADEQLTKMPSELNRYLGSLNVKAFIVPESNPYYKTIDGILYTKDGDTLIRCPKNKPGDIVIPDTAKYIMPGSFSGCEMQSVSIPGSILDIGAEAFSYCPNLNHVTLDEKITHLNYPDSGRIFAGCKSMRYIDLPWFISSIGSSIFSNVSIDKLILHEGLIYVGEYSFPDIKDDEIYLPESLHTVKCGNFLNQRIFHVHTMLPCGLLNSVISSGSFRQKNPLLKFIFHISDEEERIVYLPSCLDMQKREYLNKLLSQIPIDKIDDSVFEGLYKECACKEAIQDTAVAYYEITKDPEIAAFLKRYKTGIINRYFRENDEKSLVKFLQFGLLTHTALQKLLATAQEKEMSVLSSYILHETATAPAKRNVSFVI